jgi:integrase
MASIHRRPDSCFWYCSFRLPDGSWALRSTKETEAKSAQRVCIAYEATAEKAAKGLLVEAQARRVITDIAEMANGEPLITESIATFLQSWAQDKARSRAEGTGVRYQEIADELILFLGPKSQRPIQHLTARDIQGYRDSLLERGLKKSTANLTLKALRSALNGAKRQGYISHNPGEAVDTLPIDAIEKEVFTQRQVKDIIAEADEEWEGVTLYGNYTGARLRNCADARWEQIDWKKRAIRYKPVKKKKNSPMMTLLVPIHPDLWRYLKRRHRQGMTGPIFPHLTQKRTGGKTGLSLTFRDLMVKAGVKFTAQEKTGDGRRVYSLGF